MQSVFYTAIVNTDRGKGFYSVPVADSSEYSLIAGDEKHMGLNGLLSMTLPVGEQDSVLLRDILQPCQEPERPAFGKVIVAQLPYYLLPWIILHQARIFVGVGNCHQCIASRQPYYGMRPTRHRHFPYHFPVGVILHRLLASVVGYEIVAVRQSAGIPDE